MNPSAASYSMLTSLCPGQPGIYKMEAYIAFPLMKKAYWDTMATQSLATRTSLWGGKDQDYLHYPIDLLRALSPRISTLEVLA